MKQREYVKLKESVKNANPESRDHRQSHNFQSSLALTCNRQFRAKFGLSLLTYNTQDNIIFLSTEKRTTSLFRLVLISSDIEAA